MNRNSLKRKKSVSPIIHTKWLVTLIQWCLSLCLCVSNISKSNPKVWKLIPHALTRFHIVSLANRIEGISGVPNPSPICFPRHVYQSAHLVKPQEGLSVAITCVSFNLDNYFPYSSSQEDKFVEEGLMEDMSCIRCIHILK